MERPAARFDNAPMMIYWEMTRACDLACRHCRAEAVSWRNPDELTTEEGFALLAALAGFGSPTPHLVLTGGDPLKRPDVFSLIERAVALGLPVSITPSGTPLLTQEAILRLRDAGINMVALSLDGSDAKKHDRIRQVPGSFRRTVEAARWVRDAGLPLQINSLVCAETVADLADVHQRVCQLDADRWSVFFLVTVGRGTALGQVDPYECEAVLEWLYDLAREAPRPIIKTTEAHHYRRIALQKQRQAAKTPVANGANGGSAVTQAALRRGFGIRDGAGIMFISHTGDVYPSGFLPVSAGNVRQADPVRLYRESPLFVQLRDPAQLKGKCVACEYRVICGGARSRAWAATGDLLQADPLCVYQPAGYAPAH